MSSSDAQFSIGDMVTLTALVSSAWLSGADRDWSAQAGQLEWTCLHTADHAVDCVYAPAFFLASRKVDDYPTEGGDLTLGAKATPPLLVESLNTATRILRAVINDCQPDDRAVIFRGTHMTISPPADFAPRAALELALHAYDVCQGLDIDFLLPRDLCQRLRDHTRQWPFWSFTGAGLPFTTDPWLDLLVGSGRFNLP